MIRIGTSSFNYDHMRNFAGLPFEDVEFKKVHDLYKIPAHFYFKFFKKVVPNYINQFNDFALNRVDLYHFFNAITPVKRPWVVTFETKVPRLYPDSRRGLEWMAGRFCKKIIGFSKRAIDIQNYHLVQYPEYREAIQSKMLLLYPSQKAIVTDVSHKNFERDIVFTITGNAFFLKGGWELLQAIERLKEEKAPVKLNIISKLEVHGYNDNHATPELVEKTRKILATNPLISHYNGLPNAEVLKLLKESHVGILPSYGETFGYSLLEAMACGCATISSSVSPFPEFIQEPWGWLVDVPVKRENGVEFTDVDDPVNHKILSDALIEGLYVTIKKILEDRTGLKDKCVNAIQRIKDFHDPMNRVRVLRDIYLNAVN